MRYGPIVLAVAALAFIAPATGQNILQQGKDLLGTFGATRQSGTDLTSGEISAGLKEALRVGTEAVVAQLGRPDGFNADKAIHIPLPKSLGTVQSTLKGVGMSSMLDDLELRLNRAAEAATPRAKELFLQTINEMTLDDVKAIFEGPDDAATRYFQVKMSGPLAEEMRPIVDSSLAEVGAIQAYEDTMGQYQKIPLVPDVKADLTGHVVDKGLDGIFHYVAKEEAAIRNNPAKRTTDLLKRVFASGS
ncbi:MAG: DUF4197 domain-containing protein [Minwuiales bacterium]|nr:DUF4197 domain-containing protein [Minwuiales bacterium]